MDWEYFIAHEPAALRDAAENDDTATPTEVITTTMTTTTPINSIRPRMRETLPKHAAFFDLWHACMHPLMLGTSAVGKGEEEVEGGGENGGEGKTKAE